MNIRLKCCCGAEIQIDDMNEIMAKQTAENWQDRHRDCKPPVQYITQQQPPIIVPPTTPTPMWSVPGTGDPLPPGPITICEGARP